VSAADHRSVNVTGPPGRLEDIFRRSSILRHSRYHHLPVFEGLAHGEHIFTSHDIDLVVDWEESNVPCSRRAMLPFLSSATGLPFPTTHPHTLYNLVCTELMGRSVHLDALKSGLEAPVAAPEVDRINLLSAGRCKNFQSIVSTLAPKAMATRVEVYDLISWTKVDPESRIPTTHKDSKLAVVGMSCRLPGGADDNELFWQLMVHGKDTCTTVPADRFNLDSHYDPSGKTPNATQTPYGNFIKKPGMFDPHFFNMSPREVSHCEDPRGMSTDFSLRLNRLIQLSASH
jgi:asperthecin polyketide synthase